MTIIGDNMRNNMSKRILIIAGIILGVLVLAFGGLFVKQAILDAIINDDISTVSSNSKYQVPVSVDGVQVIRQQVTCGYASIEMVSRWAGTPVTEQELEKRYGDKIPTATEEGFSREINRCIPAYTTTRYINLTNTKLMDMVYNSLAAGKPVPFQFAALYHEGDTAVWTLHYAVITGIDIPNDHVTVCNPYGYVEAYTVKDFLKATRYESYENMEFYFKLAFASGYFNKNTIYIMQ